MTDPIDKKSKEQRDNLDVDLDAILDKAKSSLDPMNEFEADEDAIDRLLMNTGFDEDNALIPAEVNKRAPVVKDDELHDELDGFLGFDGFGEDFNQPASVPVPVVKADEPERTVEDSSAIAADGLDDLLGLSDAFDESDMIQDEEVDTSEPDEVQQVVGDELFNELQDDENSFNKLFEDAGFDAEAAVELANEKVDEFGDDADLNDFFQLNGVSDDFSAQTEEDDFLLPDFDITAGSEVSDRGSDAGINDDGLANLFRSEAAGLLSGDNETTAELKPKQAADMAIDDVENVRLSPFEFEQEGITKQLEAAENKVKKARLFNYVALGFGIVALSAAGVLGVITHGAKTEVSKLTETVAVLEASLAKNIENNPNEEVNAVMNSVVQLNQQVYGFISEFKETPRFPVDVLNNKVLDVVAKQNRVSKALDVLQVKMGGLASMPAVVAKSSNAEAEHEHPATKEVVAHESAPASVKESHAPVKEKARAEVAQVKTEAKHEHPVVKEVVAHKSASALSKESATHEHAPIKERAIHETTTAKVDAKAETKGDAKKVEPETSSAPAKVKTQAEVINVKPVTTKKSVLNQVIAGKWGVNLVAFKQEWFAKSKAAEFARQGIFAEVIPVHEKNSTMYRLRVGGFKSKQEASSNTDRIKKSLNLDSVWVSDN